MKSGLLLLFTVCSRICLAQFFPEPDYPRDFFRNPLDIPISLAANFGELRANHYHMGLDIRTAHRENLPVYAAADGYVSRLRIEPFGFGQVIWVTHPNGFTTVYAHLNNFFPALAAYVRQKQYENESWKIFLTPPPGMFPVKKGDLIAWSGNTGGSEGPHVHFEIRTTADDVNANPMRFGLPIPDDTRPTLRRIAVYDRDRSLYDKSPLIFPVVNRGGRPALASPLITTTANRVGLGITGFDTQTGSANPNGIFQGECYADGHFVSGFRMDHISYDNTRDINAHIDYRLKATGGGYVQLLFPLPGYTASIYRVAVDGGIDLRDGLVHEAEIRLTDAAGNTTSLPVRLQHRAGTAPPRPAREGKAFYPFFAGAVERPDCEYFLTERSLYDTAWVTEKPYDISDAGVVSRVYTIGSGTIPIRDSLLVRLKPDKPLTAPARAHVVMEWFDTERLEVKKPAWQGEWASAAFRSFGNFQLVEDETPPVIGFSFADGADLSRAQRISVTVTDDLENVAFFRAELDGRWLLFTNDKARAFLYSFDEHCPPGEHVLTVRARDVAGNETVRQAKFHR